MHLALAYLTQDKNILSQHFLVTHFLLYVIEYIYFLKYRILFKNFQMKKIQLGITEDKRKQSTYTSVNKKAYSCVVLRWIKNINYLQHFCLKTLRLYKKWKKTDFEFKKTKEKYFLWICRVICLRELMKKKLKQDFLLITNPPKRSS